jgi:hypothetical protein
MKKFLNRIPHFALFLRLSVVQTAWDKMWEC